PVGKVQCGGGDVLGRGAGHFAQVLQSALQRIVAVAESHVVDGATAQLRANQCGVEVDLAQGIGIQTPDVGRGEQVVGKRHVDFRIQQAWIGRSEVFAQQLNDVAIDMLRIEQSLRLEN